MPPSKGRPPQVPAVSGRIFRKSGLPGVSYKIYDNVEEGDDYDSNEDIYSENSRPSSPSTSNLEAFESGIGRKRSSSVCEDDDAPIGTKRAKFSSTSTMTPKPSLCSRLPQTLWTEIFSLLHPADLARQRRTCKLFQRSLDDESIWRRSRKHYLPDHPRPLFGLTEWDMLCIMWGSGCMLCEQGANKGNTRPKGSAIAYWPFRVRCCKGCLGENTSKEFTLLSPTSPTAALLPALPFGIVDLRNNWISNPTHYQPNIGLTKIFWNADISDILERYREAVDMGAQEEWLNGLEAEGLAHKLDVMRIERFERLNIIVQETASDDASEIGYGKESQLKQRQPDFSQQTHGDHSQQQVYAQGPHQRYRKISTHESIVSASNLSASPQSIDPRPKFVQGHSIDGPKNDIMQQLDTSESPISVSIKRTPLEVAGMKAKRRSDIETCCLRIFPSLEPGLLLHLPAFQAAVGIALPLNEHAWENLKVKLSEKLPDADKQESFKRVEWQKLQQHLEEHKALEKKQKESKERKEKEWDDFQTPVHQKLRVYADEIINHWVGSITKETAPKFAADVLSHCRRRFYEENPYSADDPYHITPLDPTTRVGQATLEVPTTRRLTLENMKFVFDSRIRPSTDQFGKEIFLCSGCEYNPRFYAFESVIQHYAAKHTSQLSVGPIVVHWKADWPAKPPFNPDPLVTGMVAYVTSTVPGSSQTKTNSKRQPCPSPHETIVHQPTGQYRSTLASSYNSTRYPGYIHPSRNQQAQQGFTLPQVIARTHPAYLEQIAKDAREAWFQLSGIKDLPSSVRIYYVISKTITSFQAIFSSEPTLPVFIEALKEYASLKAVKNANGLLCLECHRNPPPPALDRANRAGRLFTFSALLQHFQIMHIARNRATIKPVWKTEMVKLPETRIIGMIRQAQGMDTEKYNLLKSVFALAFSLPLPGTGFNGAIERASSVPMLENRPASLKSMTSPEQKGPRFNDTIHHRKCDPIAAAVDRGYQNSQTDLDYQYSRNPIDPHSSYLEPRPMKTWGESTSSVTTRSDSRGHPPAPPEQNLLQRPAQPYENEHTMNAAERFLENFLRNTNDEQTPGSNVNEKKVMSRSPRASRNSFEPSTLQLTGPEYQDHWVKSSPRVGIDSHYSPENGAYFDSSREYSHEIVLLTLDANRHDHNLPRPCNTTPSNGTVSGYPSTGQHQNDNRARSPNRSLHCDQYHRGSPTHLVEKYNKRSYAEKGGTCSDKPYPPPLPSNYYDMGDPHWSPKTPMAYPVPPLPRVLPDPGSYNSQYGTDYRGRKRFMDLLPLLSRPLAQYPRYLPPRSLVSEATYRHRSRSPVPVITRPSEKIAMPYTSASGLLSRGYVSLEDHRKMNAGNSSRYHQPRREEREPENVVWQGQGTGRGRGDRGRGGVKTNSGRY